MEDDLDIRNLDEELKIAPKRKAKAKLPKQKSKAGNRIILLLAILFIAALALVVMNLTKVFGPKQDTFAAAINGQNISDAYVDKLYKLEVHANQSLPRNIFIYNFVVPRILLLQEASERTFDISDQDVEEQVAKLYTDNFTEDDLQALLSSKGLTVEEYRSFTKENMLISNLLTNTVRSKITVTDTEVQAFYERYKDTLFRNRTLTSRLRGDIHGEIYRQKELQATGLYINQLIKKSEIAVYSTSKATGNTFTATPSSVCTQEGKPIVRFYATSSCESCTWIKPAFDAAVNGYVNQDRIVAYHWQLDTGDDLMTSGKETKIPSGEASYFKSLSPSSQVPVFSFGCTYVRLGTAFDSHADEETEFRIVIEKILG